MKIIIESQESGWAVTRTADLPEDEKLVKTILRAVRRHGEKSGGGDTDTPPRDAGADSGGQEAETGPENEELRRDDQLDGAGGDREAERVAFEEPAYRGFLIVKCEGCGETRAFCSKAPIRRSACRKCGHETTLENMAPVELRCPNCGKRWIYTTNSEDTGVTANCVECGTEMTGWWDQKKKKYRTM